MQIDWITVTAQLVNFLVLIWLLKRFLYRPINQAMQRREAGIAERMQGADDARREAEKQAEALRDQRQALEHQRHELMEQARCEGKRLRDQLEREAREEAEELRRAWRRQVDDEKDAFLDSVRLSTVRYVGDLARSALKELADVDLEAQAAKRFADHLRVLDGKNLHDLVAAAESDQATALIESPFELSGAIKTQLTRTVHEIIAKDLDIDYREASDLLLGVRLHVGGRTVAWTLADYFDRLEARIGDALRHRGPAEQRHVA
ncbi:MAG: hypothetical protein OEU92_33280 [Alphaproteobacteria bacterium]|nr:hypothetical protein [Alphaproteobacteria bacterium]